MNSSTFPAATTDALRYWERLRLLYNAALFAVVAAVVATGAPRTVDRISADVLQTLFVLAVLANVAYCAAYPVDLLAQASDLRGLWLRIRWTLFAVGTAFACVLAEFVARGMFAVGKG